MYYIRAHNAIHMSFLCQSSLVENTFTEQFEGLVIVAAV